MKRGPDTPSPFNPEWWIVNWTHLVMAMMFPFGERDPDPVKARVVSPAEAMRACLRGNTQEEK